MRRACVQLLLILALVESTAWARGERVRARVAGVLTRLAKKISPPPPLPVESPPPPEPTTRRAGYKIVRTKELHPRGLPGEPDRLYRMTTETWTERTVKPSSGRVVAGTGLSIGKSLLSEEKGQAERVALWRRVSVLRAYLDGSTQTMRKELLPFIDQILAAGGEATEYYKHDVTATMKSAKIWVGAEGNKDTGEIKIRISEPTSWQPTIASVEFNPKLGTLTYKVHSGDWLTITETRGAPSGRALIERKTTRGRDLTQPNRAQQALDGAFKPPAAAEEAKAP